MSDGTPGVKVVEGPLKVFCPSGNKGFVKLIIDPGARYVITSSRAPWDVRLPTEEQLKLAKEAQQAGARASRASARDSEFRESWIFGEDNERALSVRLNEKCPGEAHHKFWKRLACGHVHCAHCDGHVCPNTLVALKGPGPIVKCNRLPKGVEDYDFLFRENYAGSRRLTDAMIKELGKNRVDAPLDIKFSPDHDITQKWVYERRKKEAKARRVLYSHYSPKCSSFSKAQRSHMERSADAPYGIGARDTVVHDNVMFLRTVALCTIHHMVGDFFTLEHIFPTLALEFEQTKELLSLPGVFLLTWDNCQYKEVYRHRQRMITNAPWFAWLSRDCQGVVVGFHEHAVTSGDGIDTTNLSPLAYELVSHWAKLYGVFVKAPAALKCPFCANLAGNPKLVEPKVSARRVLERCLRQSQVVQFVEDEQTGDSTSGGEEMLENSFDMEGREAVLRVSLGKVPQKAMPKQLGARSRVNPPVQKNRGKPSTDYSPHELVHGVVLKKIDKPVLDDKSKLGLLDDKSLQKVDRGSDDSSSSEVPDLGDFPDDYDEVNDEESEHESEQINRILESARKGAHNSYKAVGKKDRQAELFPKLQAEVDKLRKELWRGLEFPTAESRRSAEFRDRLLKESAGKIGGTADEQMKFFDQVIASYPETFWIEGCAAPRVKNYKIRFRLKQGAKPVARQPIPMSPYDDMRVEYFLEEAVSQGKLRKINVLVEPIPEWATPVFIGSGRQGAFGPYGLCLRSSQQGVGDQLFPIG